MAGTGCAADTDAIATREASAITRWRTDDDEPASATAGPTRPTEPHIRCDANGCSAPVARRGAPRPPVDAADAALIAHWPRLAQRACGCDELIEMGLDAGDAIATSGWFDSTWELAQGLEISEVQLAELPLDGWLQFYLAS